jgi:Tfp pilus assembly protein PilF
MASDEPPPPEPRAATVENPDVTPSDFMRSVIAFAGLAVFVAAAIVFGWRAGSAHTGAPPPRHRPAPAVVALYRSGLHSWQTRTPAGLNRAVEDFNQAIAHDPDYAEAYAGLADCYNLLREFTLMPPGEAYPKAKAAADRAITLDPSLAGAHASLAFVDFYWLRDTAGARREFGRALALDPASAVAHHWYATFLMTMGEFDAALAEIGRAEEFDSESRAVQADKGLILFHAGETEAAIRQLGRVAEEEPSFVSPHRYLAVIYRAIADDANYLEQLRLLAAALKDQDGLSIADAAAQGFRQAGHDGMAAAILARQQALYPAGRVSAYALAQTFAALDDIPDALAYLEISVTRGEDETIGLAIDPIFAPLRSDAGFRALIARCGLQNAS